MIQGKNGATIKNEGIISQDDSAPKIPILDSLQPKNSLNSIQADSLQPLSLNASLPSKIFKAIDISGKSNSFNYGTINLTGKDFVPKNTDNKPCLVGMIADGTSNATNEVGGTISLSSKLSKDANLTIANRGKDMLKPWPAAMYAHNGSTITNKGSISDTAQFDSSMLASLNSHAINTGTITLNNYKSDKTETFFKSDGSKFDGFSGMHIAMTAFNHSALVNNGTFKMSNVKGDFSNTYQVPYKFMYATDYSTLTNNKDITIEGVAGQTLDKELEVLHASDNSGIINQGDITVKNVTYQLNGSNDQSHISLLNLEGNSTLINSGKLTIENSNITGNIFAIETDKNNAGTSIVNNGTILIKNSSAKEDPNDKPSGYVGAIQVSDSTVKNTADITIDTLNGGSSQDARLAEVQGNGKFINTGNLLIKNSKNAVGVYLDGQSSKFDNTGGTITIDSSSSSSCAIKGDISKIVSGGFGTIEFDGKSYNFNNYKTAPNPDGKGNKIICP